MRKLTPVLSGLVVAAGVIGSSPSEVRADVLLQDCEGEPVVSCSAGFFKNHEAIWNSECCDESGEIRCSNLLDILKAKGNSPLRPLRDPATEQLNQCLACRLASEDLDESQVSCEITPPPPPPPVCGNEVVEEGEQCDPPGRVSEALVCNEFCQLVESPEEPVCGNGIVEAGEECDPPGPIEPGVACSDTCQVLDVPIDGGGGGD